MSGLQGFVEDGRRLLRMAGADAREVLQSVVTNDIDRLGPGHAIYAALLTAQGKYLADFLLIDDADGADGAVLIDADAGQAAALARRLRMYCLRRDARIAEAPELGVALLWGAPAPEAPEGATLLPDPRAPALGWRLYAPDPAAALAATGAAPADRAAYDALRVAHSVPASGVELVPDDTYILEAGFEALNGVDFRKGCYVGQEVTARMKHKTELKKRLVRVRVEGAAPPGTPVTAEGKPAGTLFTQADGLGLANLRLDRAKGPLSADAARVFFDA